MEAKEKCEENGYILASILTENDFDAARVFVSRYLFKNSTQSHIVIFISLSLPRSYGLAFTMKNSLTMILHVAVVKIVLSVKTSLSGLTSVLELVL